MLYSSSQKLFLPSICVVDVNFLVERSNRAQRLGRVESDAQEGVETGTGGEGVDFLPGAGVVDVNFVAR